MQPTSSMLYYYHFGALKRGGGRKKKQITSSQVTKREKEIQKGPSLRLNFAKVIEVPHIEKETGAKKDSGKKGKNRELIANGVAYVTTCRYVLWKPDKTYPNIRHLSSKIS